MVLQLLFLLWGTFNCQGSEKINEINNQIMSIRSNPVLPPPLSYDDYLELGTLENKPFNFMFLTKGIAVLDSSRNNLYQLDIKDKDPMEVLASTSEIKPSRGSSNMKFSRENVLPRFPDYKGHYHLTLPNRQVIRLADTSEAPEFSKELEILSKAEVGQDHLIWLYNKDTNYLAIHYAKSAALYWEIINNPSVQLQQIQEVNFLVYYLCDEDSDYLRLWCANYIKKQKTLVELPINGPVHSYSVSNDEAWLYVKMYDQRSGGYQIYEYSKETKTSTHWAKRSKNLQAIIYKRNLPRIALIQESSPTSLSKYFLRYSKDGGLKTERILLHDNDLKSYDKNSKFTDTILFTDANFLNIPSLYGSHRIPTILWLPSFVKETGFPLYFDIHGGPDAQSEVAFNAYAQYWTSRGYAVAEVNYQGSTGFGNSWQTALNGHVGEYDAQDCYSAVRYLYNHLKRLDKQRVYIGGASWGAYITASIILSPSKYDPIFAAAELRCGVYDCGKNGEFENNSLSSQDIEKKERWLQIYGGNPYEDEELNKRISPLFKAAEVPAELPIHISHGGKDSRANPQIAEIFSSTLKEYTSHIVWSFYPESDHDYINEDEKDCLKKTEKIFSDLFVKGSPL